MNKGHQDTLRDNVLSIFMETYYKLEAAMNKILIYE
jgi:hypothetical protein